MPCNCQGINIGSSSLVIKKPSSDTIYDSKDNSIILYKVCIPIKKRKEHETHLIAAESKEQAFEIFYDNYEISEEDRETVKMEKIGNLDGDGLKIGMVV